MTDLASRIADGRKKAEKATPGPWEDDSIRNAGNYGSGEDINSGFNSYAVYAGEKVVCDTLNSDLILVEEEYDEDRRSAWDEVGRKNMAYIAAASPDLFIEMADEIDRLTAELEKARQALEPFANMLPAFLDFLPPGAEDCAYEINGADFRLVDIRTAARVHADLTGEKENEE